MNRVAFIYDDILTRHVLSNDHVFVPARLRYTYELLEFLGAFGLLNSTIHPPRSALLEELLSFHTKEYVEAVRFLSENNRSIDGTKYNFSFDGDNPIYKGMFESALLTTGASIVAAEELMQGRADIAVNFSGGLHHAMPNKASGFCIFDDPVIAINSLVANGLRVAYIDVDCHHGDGVQLAFDNTDQVITISLHESGEFLFPGTGFTNEIGEGSGTGYSVNIPLHPYTDDDTYLRAFDNIVPPIIESYKPDVLVTQLGIDTHVGDPITHLRLTVQGFTAIVKRLSTLSPGRWLALGGGGYNISAVIRGWSRAFGIMLENEWPNEINNPIADRYDIHFFDDPVQDSMPENIREEIKKYAERSVAKIQELVFPIHGL